MPNPTGTVSTNTLDVERLAPMQTSGCGRSLGCDVAQGFHLGHPVSAEEVLSDHLGGRRPHLRVGGIASSA